MIEVYVKINYLRYVELPPYLHNSVRKSVEDKARVLSYGIIQPQLGLSVCAVRDDLRNKYAKR